MRPVPPNERGRGAPRRCLPVPCFRPRYLIAVGLLACTRSAPIDPPSRVDPAPAPVGAPTTPPEATPIVDASPPPPLPPAPWAPDAKVVDGPHAIAWESGRPIWWAAPREAPGKLRLVAHLHGMCGPPSYACGRWVGAGTSFGLMVCPTGNARCGDSAVGPPSWEAPSWPELVAIMDHDLEAAIAAVAAKRPLEREGAVLTGYSRGGFATPVIARRHPGRWPYLVVIEANVPLSASELKASGVRAVALVAGEQGTELAGMQRTTAALVGTGYPATLVVMKRTGHPYSEDMEYVMRQALEFLFEKRDAAP